jgi:hypothetical protein
MLDPALSGHWQTIGVGCVPTNERLWTSFISEPEPDECPRCWSDH